MPGAKGPSWLDRLLLWIAALGVGYVVVAALWWRGGALGLVLGAVALLILALIFLLP